MLAADFIQGIAKSDFSAAWEEMGADNEVEETYALSSFKTIEEAIKNVITFLGMAPCDRSDRVQEGKSSHILYMSGMFRGKDEVLVRAKLALSSNPENGVTMKLSVRCNNLEVSNFIVSVIA